jgi:hypothetical protein
MKMERRDRGNIVNSQPPIKQLGTTTPAQPLPVEDASGAGVWRSQRLHGVCEGVEGDCGGCQGAERERRGAEGAKGAKGAKGAGRV